MGALDFLFEGKPPPSTTTYGSSTSDLPSWLSDYTQGLIGRANAIAGEEYQPYGGPRLAAMTPDQERAISITRQASGNYNPLMTSATGAAQGALGQATPYLQQAGQTFPGAAQQYMDPYIQNVIDRGSLEANRTLNEKFLPSVANYFGAAGASPRSTQMRATVDRGVRDLTEGLNTQNQAALSQAYQSGANIFGQDMSRLGQLGQTVGNLGLNSAQVQSGLAETGQNLALRDAAAQSAAGEALQADEQRSLDLAYGDFQQQRDYPRQNVDWLSGVIRGTPHGQTTSSTTTGPAEIMGPSTIGQLGSLATGIAGIWDIFKAKGGRIRRRAYNHGGALRYSHA